MAKWLEHQTGNLIEIYFLGCGFDTTNKSLMQYFYLSYRLLKYLNLNIVMNMILQTSFFNYQIDLDGKKLKFEIVFYD